MRLVTSSSITWSQWCSLSQQRLPAIVARAAGLYRVRSTSMDELLYIGQSNNLRRRILELRGAIQDSEMPWNDPHVAAARFWALLQNADHDFEISVARTTADVIARKSLESLAISLYRADLGGAQSSTLGECQTDGSPRLAEARESEEASTLTSHTQRTKTQSSRRRVIRHQPTGLGWHGNLSASLKPRPQSRAYIEPWRQTASQLFTSAKVKI